MWTEERIDELRSLWRAGYSCSVIAKQFATTRNAVIGKVHRLDLPPRKTLVTGERRAPVDKRWGIGGTMRKQHVKPRVAVRRFGDGVGTYVRKIKSQDAPVSRAAVDLPEPVSRDMSILDLKAGQCKWAHGDGPFLFCGAPTEGRSYCPHHYARTVQPEWRTKAMKRRDDRLARF